MKYILNAFPKLCDRKKTHLDYVRAVCYDESVYPEPHIFNPARFLDKHGNINPFEKAPEDKIFGSGRRYECPHYTFPFST
jgi:cytochrome P450